MSDQTSKEFIKYKYECLGKVVFDDNKYMEVRGLLQRIPGLLMLKKEAAAEDLEEIIQAIEGIKKQIEEILK